MIRRIVRYRVRPGEEQAAVEAIATFVAAVADEPGTSAYRAYRYADGDGTEFVHTMAFVDDDARERHTKTPHVQAFVETLYPLCVEQPAFRDLDLVASSVDLD